MPWFHVQFIALQRAALFRTIIARLFDMMEILFMATTFFIVKMNTFIRQSIRQ